MSFFVMAKTVLKSLFSRPVTRKHPFEKRECPPQTRGRLSIEIKKCIFCGLCQKKCPTAALAVNREEKAWTINRLRCISCGYCVDVCPKKCLSLLCSYPDLMLTKSEETHRA
jgi:ech hydrogenase subunit F